ncbi:MAG TPA: hypothetical protein QF626_02215 [Prochlorococcaceae cyanobacterium Fu_MAG_50]|nr:hypothetical protein [Prochlorococcaceae cyanobacterium Fu_MAG_50]
MAGNLHAIERQGITAGTRLKAFFIDIACLPIQQHIYRHILLPFSDQHKHLTGLQLLSWQHPYFDKHTDIAD